MGSNSEELGRCYGGECHDINRQCKAATSLSYSPDARILASGHEDKAIRLWDPRGGDAVSVRSCSVDTGGRGGVVG